MNFRTPASNDTSRNRRRAARNSIEWVRDAEHAPVKVSTGKHGRRLSRVLVGQQTVHVASSYNNFATS